MCMYMYVYIHIHICERVRIYIYIYVHVPTRAAGRQALRDKKERDSKGFVWAPYLGAPLNVLSLLVLAKC